MRFAPDSGAADPSSWRMAKLGRPISPLEVIANGSYSQHAVGDEGVAVRGAGVGSWETLSIRCAHGWLGLYLVSLHIFYN